MRTVPLVNHPWYALVDDADYERVSQYEWTLGAHGYVVRRDDSACLMHRFLMSPADGVEVDHANRVRTDNRRSCNLRLSTRGQNEYNKPKRRTHAGKPPLSQYKGVTWHSFSRSWQAQAWVKGKRISLRYHKKEEDAARAYDAFAREHYGVFALLNFPQQAVQPLTMRTVSTVAGSDLAGDPVDLRMRILTNGSATG